ncbi:MAG: amidase domain-containing protein [Clostridiales Family XIII bacterium]|jgi:hypothetical protein|nr:amidase domain-containing protein [Clostridiales Family XIII bacterium]
MLKAKPKRILCVAAVAAALLVALNMCTFLGAGEAPVSDAAGYALGHTDAAGAVGVAAGAPAVGQPLDYLLSTGFDRNQSYYSYENNCANFVSQALHAGGLPMTEGWHSYADFSEPRKVLGIPVFKLWPYLSNYSASWDVSEAWRLADAQRLYFSDPANGYIDGEPILIERGDEDLPGAFAGLQEQGVKAGDLLYWLKKGKDGAYSAYHVTLITKVTAGGVYYSGNSYTRHNASVLDVFLGPSYYDAVEVVRLGGGMPE